MIVVQFSFLFFVKQYCSNFHFIEYYFLYFGLFFLHIFSPLFSQVDELFMNFFYTFCVDILTCMFVLCSFCLIVKACRRF